MVLKVYVENVDDQIELFIHIFREHFVYRMDLAEKVSVADC